MTGGAVGQVSRLAALRQMRVDRLSVARGLAQAGVDTARQTHAARVDALRRMTQNEAALFDDLVQRSGAITDAASRVAAVNRALEQMHQAKTQAAAACQTALDQIDAAERHLAQAALDLARAQGQQDAVQALLGRVQRQDATWQEAQEEEQMSEAHTARLGRAGA